MSRLLTVDDVAAYLGVKPSWVRTHLSELPHLRVGPLIRFRADDVDAHIANRVVNPTPTAQYMPDHEPKTGTRRKHPTRKA